MHAFLPYAPPEAHPCQSRTAWHACLPLRAPPLQVGLIYATVFQLGLNTLKASPFPAASVSVGIAGFACSSALKVRCAQAHLSAVLCHPQDFVHQWPAFQLLGPETPLRSMPAPSWPRHVCALQVPAPLVILIGAIAGGLIWVLSLL